MSPDSSPPPYVPARPSASRFEPVRGLRLHLRQWGDAGLLTPDRPPLVLLHGWMDMGASYQFLVDALAALEGPRRWILAPDARGFGLSEAPAADGYWFPDYLGDLDALLDRVSPEGPVDLLGHSMGGNVAMLYAGVRPARVRRLVDLEGFGLPRSDPQQAPQRYAQWLDELKRPPRLRPYASLAAVAARLMANDPHLTPARAGWLAMARTMGPISVPTVHSAAMPITPAPRKRALLLQSWPASALKAWPLSGVACAVSQGTTRPQHSTRPSSTATPAAVPMR